MNGRRDDGGESLIELLISLVIISIAVFTVFEGIRLSIQASDIHRKETTASVYVRDYAEAIENTVAADNYATGTGSYPGVFVPTDHTYTASITSAQCGPGTSWTACSAATDVGLQRLTLRVSSADGRASEQLVIVVRKPCGPGSSCT
jgi:type II secretory pathway pseudopilin PulG